MRYLILILFVFLSACQQQEDSPVCDLVNVICACDKTTQSTQTCTDYYGKKQNSASESCSSGENPGTFQAELCPTSGVLGTCLTSTLGQEFYLRYYNESGVGQTACALTGGVWQ